MSASASAFEEWEQTPASGRKVRARCRLGLMVALSLLAHAATFYVFQVAYTPAGSLLPPPARVVLLPLDRPENASFARWLALANPTLTIQPDSPANLPAPDFPGSRYSPSYATASPAFKPLDPGASSEAISAPPPFLPGPVAMTNAPTVKPSAPTETPGASLPGPSRVVFGPGLRERLASPPPPVRFVGGASQPAPEPSVVLVGVRAEGGEPFLFPMRQAPAGSGSTNADEADELARGYLARLTFQPAADPGVSVVWGKVTFYWGVDSSPAAP